MSNVNEGNAVNRQNLISQSVKLRTKQNNTTETTAKSIKILYAAMK